MEKNMEATMMGYVGVIGYICFVFWWLNPVRQYSLYKNYTPKGGYNLIL